jgi:hypothetical protein
MLEESQDWFQETRVCVSSSSYACILLLNESQDWFQETRVLLIYILIY